MTLADGEATTVTFQFSEAVTGFIAGDVSVAGGVLSGFTQVDADTWTATFTQDGSATAPSISVADGTFTDLAGNPGTGDTLDGTDGFTADIAPPVVVFSDTTSNDTTPALTGTVDDPTATVVVTVGGVDYTATNNGDGTWTLPDDTLPALPDGDHVVVVTATDPAGNTDTDTGTLTIDTTGPTLSITATDMTLADGEATTVTFQFSEAVTGFIAGDVSVAGGVLSGFTQVDADTWTATFTQDGSATAPSISVADGTFTDLAGNPGTGDTLDGTDGFTADIVAPTLTIDSISDDTGTADFITNDTTLSIHGTVEPADRNSLTVTINGTTTYTVGDGFLSVDVTGNWTLDLTATTLSAGSYLVLASATDTAGNTASTTQNIVINQAPDITDTLASVSEEGLAGGSPDTDGTPTDTTNANTVSGTMTFTDPDTTIASVSVSGPANVTSAGVSVSWSGVFAAGIYTLTGTAGATTVATLTVDTDGDYTFTLLQPLDHPIDGVEDILALAFDVTATDSESASGSGTLAINVEDDMPLAADPTLHTIDALPTAVPITGDVSVTYGADGGYIARVGVGDLFLTFDPATETLVESGNSDLVFDYTYDAGTDDLTIRTVKGETFVIDMLSGEYTYEASDTPLLPAESPAAPVVALGDDSLLDLIGVSALNLIDFSQTQLFAATDANNNIESVTINITALSISLGAGFEVAGGLAMANELGLTYDNSNRLGVLDFETEITISALGGGPIDNQQLNEFLGAVYFSTGLLNIGLLSTVTITAEDTGGLTDSESNSDILDLGLLGTAPPAYLELGTAAGETLTGTAGSDRLYGFDGDDTLNADAGADILRGGAGDDILNGEDGNDVLIGGSGNDTLTGGSGNDVFLWEDGDQSATPGLATAASDTVTDSNAAAVSSGGDLIDLGNLLQGEGRIGTDPGNLVRYLHFTFDGTNTVLYISSAGNFTDGYDDVNDPANVDQIITFNGADLRQGLTTDHEIIENLLANGNLIVDEATASTDLLGGTTTIDVVIADGDGDTAGTQIIFDSSGATLPPPVVGNVAPIVQASEFSLLGIIGAEALTLIDLSSQDFIAADANGNLSSVVIAYRPLLDVNLIPLQLTASSALAAELGLQFSVENDPGLLGLVAPSSVLTITAIGGGDIDNLAINELLATVKFDNAADLLGLSLGLQAAVLDATTITAADSAGLTASDSLGNLADISALHTLLGDNTTIIEGDGGNNTLTGDGDNERLYGYGGDDIITGGSGADLIRGGAGIDTLSGGDGNDVLIDGNGADVINGDAGNDLIWLIGTGFDSIDGGTGFDTLYLGDGIDLDTTGRDLSSIERINLGTGDGESVLTLTAAAVLAMTDDPDNTLQVIGDADDQVVMLGATLTDNVVVDGVAYAQYALGAATVLVEEEVSDVIVA
jgi:T1SS-143 domain-containing protein